MLQRAPRFTQRDFSLCRVFFSFFQVRSSPSASTFESSNYASGTIARTRLSNAVRTRESCAQLNQSPGVSRQEGFDFLNGECAKIEDPQQKCLTLRKDVCSGTPGRKYHRIIPPNSTQPAQPHPQHHCTSTLCTGLSLHDVHNGRAPASGTCCELFWMESCVVFT